MRQNGSRILTMIMMAAVAAVATLAITSLDRQAGPMAAGMPGIAEGSPEINESCADAATADVFHAVRAGSEDDLIELAGICRMAPECSEDSDCDARCGVGQGKCGHSRCPIRVCRCR